MQNEVILVNQLRDKSISTDLIIIVGLEHLLKEQANPLGGKQFIQVVAFNNFGEKDIGQSTDLCDRHFLIDLFKHKISSSKRRVQNVYTCLNHAQLAHNFLLLLSFLDDSIVLVVYHQTEWTVQLGTFVFII
jgi:hypothetical protein